MIATLAFSGYCTKLYWTVWRFLYSLILIIFVNISAQRGERNKECVYDFSINWFGEWMPVLFFFSFKEEAGLRELRL